MTPTDAGGAVPGGMRVSEAGGPTQGGMRARGCTPSQRYATVVEAYLGHPGVTPPSDESGAGSAFGAAALKVNDKIFAMLVRDRFVVKLPRRRVDDLVAGGEGEPFDAGRGRPMKEWVALPPGSGCDWVQIAGEALAFVGGGSSAALSP